MFDVLADAANGTIAGLVAGSLTVGATLSAIWRKARGRRAAAPPAVDPQQCQRHGVEIVEVRTRVDGLEKQIDSGFASTTEQIRGVHARVGELKADMRTQLDRIYRAANGRGSD